MAKQLKENVAALLDERKRLSEEVRELTERKRILERDVDGLLARMLRLTVEAK